MADEFSTSKSIADAVQDYCIMENKGERVCKLLQEALQFELDNWNRLFPKTEKVDRYNKMLAKVFKEKQ